MKHKINKKIIVGSLAAMLVLTGCGNKDKSDEKTGLKMGVGIYNSTSASDATAEKAGKFESNVTYAAVIMEGDKVKDVFIDTAQNKIEVQFDGKTSFEPKATKRELGDSYGMAKDGKLEWYKQIEELEKWMKGKTLTEIKGGSDLSSSVSIKTEPYMTAVEKAISSATEVKGLDKFAITSKVSAKFGEVETLEIGTIVTAVATDESGKIIYSFIDESQMKANQNLNKVEVLENLKTKGELKEDYGMSKAGKTEWYKQVEAVNAKIVGKTATELKVDDADVVSSASITLDSIMESMIKTIEVIK